jgi:hypothetical protein
MGSVTSYNIMGSKKAKAKKKKGQQKYAKFSNHSL